MTSANNDIAPAKKEAQLDQILVNKVIEGNKKAFDLLVLKYQHKIASAVWSYVKDQDEVMDLTQEIFIRIYRNIHTFKGESAFYSWMYRIALNTAKNYQAAQKIRPPKQDIDHEEAFVHEGSENLVDFRQPDDILDAEQLLTITQTVIDELPEELKEIIHLREIEGMEYEEIAKTLQCPIGTVRSRLFRARKLIQDKVQQQL